MPNAKPLSSIESAFTRAEPLNIGDQLTVVHINGQKQTVSFEGVFGDKLRHVVVRWGIAGLYDVHYDSGQLIGGKPRRKASVWRVTDDDLSRIHATASKERAERKERLQAGRRR